MVNMHAALRPRCCLLHSLPCEFLLVLFLLLDCKTLQSGIVLERHQAVGIMIYSSQLHSLWLAMGFAGQLKVITNTYTAGPWTC